MAFSSPEIILLSSLDWQDYELLDSGTVAGNVGGQKLERYGEYLLIRPEAEALWQPAFPQKEWKKAHAEFIASEEKNGGHWDVNKKLPDRWQIGYKGLRFWVQTTASRHVGIFPEQACYWDWISNHIRSSRSANKAGDIQVLNLFGYTGAASLAASQAGASVTHLDAAHKVITWANENAVLSGLGERPIRWIVDDAMKFVEREVRRGSRYDGLILDPPKFGRGPKGEVWEFYKLLPRLLAACRGILSPQPLFVALTAYAVKASALTLHYAVDEMMRGFTGRTEAGEIVLNEKSAGRLLSTAIFARWCAT